MYLLASIYRRLYGGPMDARTALSWAVVVASPRWGEWVRDLRAQCAAEDRTPTERAAIATRRIMRRLSLAH